MPVELRKRKEAPPAPVRAAKKKAPAKDKKPEEEKTVVEKVQEAVTEQVEAVKEAVVGKSNGKSTAAAAPAKSGPPKVGDKIDLAIPRRALGCPMPSGGDPRGEQGRRCTIYLPQGFDTRM